MGGRLWVPVPSGPLARYAAGYGSWLATRGYSRWTVAHRLWQLDLLSRWLVREGLRPDELTAERVEAFLEARLAAGCSTWSSARSTALPLGYLRGLGVVPAAAAVVADGPLERLLEDYRCWAPLPYGTPVPLTAGMIGTGTKEEEVAGRRTLKRSKVPTRGPG